MKTNTIVTFALLVAAITSSRVSANLISNGSFESPAGNPGLNSGRPDGWTGYAGFANGIINGVVDSFPAPQDGNQYVTLTAGELTQGFHVTTPGDYLVTWYENSLTTGWNGSYAVRVRDDSQANLAFAPFGYSYLGSHPWEAKALLVAGLTVGDYTLTFDPGTTYTFIDNVSVDLEAVQAPNTLPDQGSTAGALGVTFGIMGLLRGRSVKR